MRVDRLISHCALPLVFATTLGACTSTPPRQGLTGRAELQGQATQVTPEAAPPNIQSTAFEESLRAYLEQNSPISHESQLDGDIEHFIFSLDGGSIFVTKAYLGTGKMFIDLLTPQNALVGTCNGNDTCFVNELGQEISVPSASIVTQVQSYLSIHPDVRIATAITGDFGYRSPEGTAMKIGQNRSTIHVNYGRAAFCFGNNRAHISKAENLDISKCYSIIGGGPVIMENGQLPSTESQFYPGVGHEDFAALNARRDRMLQSTNVTFVAIDGTGQYVLLLAGISVRGSIALETLQKMGGWTAMMLDDLGKTNYMAISPDGNVYQGHEHYGENTTSTLAIVVRQ